MSPDVLEIRDIRNLAGRELRRLCNRLSDVLPAVANEGGIRFHIAATLLYIDEVELFRVDDGCLEVDEKKLRDILYRYLKDELSTEEKVLCYEPFKHTYDRYGKQVEKLEKSIRGIKIGDKNYRIIVIVSELQKKGHESLKKTSGALIDAYTKDIEVIIKNQLERS